MPASDLQLTATQIDTLFQLLNQELAKLGSVGELYVVGGAVMCLHFKARPATRDIDALFKPSKELRLAATRVALSQGLPENWLNDGVKAFLGDRPEYRPYLDLPHLKVYLAVPEYLLALKCAAMRIGEGFQDIADVRYLLRHLNIETPAAALSVITRYFALQQFPQKTLYALEEILAEQ